jgi:hypothetical protein
MAGEIVRPHIGLGLNNFSRQVPAVETPNQDFTQQVFGNLQRWSSIERPPQFHQDLPKMKKEASGINL